MHSLHGRNTGMKRQYSPQWFVSGMVFMFAFLGARSLYANLAQQYTLTYLGAISVDALPFSVNALDEVTGTVVGSVSDGSFQAAYQFFPNPHNIAPSPSSAADIKGSRIVGYIATGAPVPGF